MLKSLVAAAAMAVAALLLPVNSASATTIAPCGSAHTIGGVGDDTEFIGVLIAAGGPGSCSIDFTASSGPLQGTAKATIEQLVADTFTGLTLSWVSLVNGVLATTAIVVPETSLATIFAAPDDLVQSMVISWTSSLAGAGFDYSVAVEPVPVPLPLLLLGTALIGVGALARRRKVAA